MSTQPAVAAPSTVSRPALPTLSVPKHLPEHAPSEDSPPPPPYTLENPFWDFAKVVLDLFVEHAERYLEEKNVTVPEFNKPSGDRPICIIGAGAAGLYTALILDSLAIPYVIIEADSRIGGRVHTYRFPPHPDSELRSDYDYFDMGAMRFPETPWMKRVFSLLDPKTSVLKHIPKRIEYKFKSDHTFLYYNGRRLFNNTLLPADSFGITTTYVQSALLTAGGPEKMVKDVLREPRSLFLKLKKEDAFKELLKTYDKYSMRSWMIQHGISASDINFCETMDRSSGWFDRALTETVLESLAFDWPQEGEDGGDTQKPPPIKWWCFDGGSSKFMEAMHASVGTKPRLNCNVTAIADEGKTIQVTMTVKTPTSTVEVKESYAAVISTVPVSCLSVIDLSKCGIPGGNNYSQWAAIRELQYSPSIKIGMRFKNPWWENLSSGKIVGGQSYCDLPIRTIVYPSYPAEGPKSRVLIASYCWTQDAERLGSMIHRGGGADPELINLVLRNLATVHDVTVEFLEGELIDFYAWNWYQNKFSMGAFAFFGPQQFADSSPDRTDSLYANLTMPAAQNKLYLAGEATSANHAWVQGAFASSWRAVEQLLRNSPYPPAKRELFYEKWGKSEMWEEEMVVTQTKISLAMQNESAAAGSATSPRASTGV